MKGGSEIVVGEGFSLTATKVIHDMEVTFTTGVEDTEGGIGDKSTGTHLTREGVWNQHSMTTTDTSSSVTEIGGEAEGIEIIRINAELWIGENY